MLSAVEDFAISGGPRRWLKVAGGAKATVLESVVCRAFPIGIAVELGTYVAYTSMRLARFLTTASIEADAVHVCLSRRLLAHVRKSDSVEVHAAHAAEVLLRLLEERGVGATRLGFYDHRGTIFHEDFRRAQELKIFAGCVAAPCLVADNAVAPGAPLLLWWGLAGRVPNSLHLTQWSLQEFAEQAVEDWMACGTVEALGAQSAS